MDRFYTFFSIYKNQLENEMLVFISVRASVCLRAVPAGWWQLPGGSQDFPLQLLAEGFPLIHCDQMKLTAKNVLVFSLELVAS